MSADQDCEDGVSLSVGDRLVYCEGLSLEIVDVDELTVELGRETSPMGVSTWTGEKHITDVLALLDIGGWELVRDE